MPVTTKQQQKMILPLDVASSKANRNCVIFEEIPLESIKFSSVLFVDLIELKNCVSRMN